MKVHLIRKQTIEEYKRQNAQSRISFNEWSGKLIYANWDTPTDMQATFPGYAKQVNNMM